MNDATTTRPSVHTLIAQQDERDRYEAERLRPDGVIPVAKPGDLAVSAGTRPIQREVVTATKLREALVQLLVRTNQAAEHAALIAAALDGGPTNVVERGQPAVVTDAKRPLFTQFAKQVIDISQAIDLIEAQLKRIDGVLS